MAKFEVKTTEEEQAKVLEVLKEVEGKTVAVSALAEMASMSQSRVRYAILDLLEAEKIARVPTKAFNPRYIRYSYKIL